MNMPIDWPKLHLQNTLRSIDRSCPSFSSPLPLRNWRYKWFQRALTRQLWSSLILRTEHFPKTTMNPDDWNLGRTLRANSGCAIQERFLPTIPKVFDLRRSGLPHEGSPWRGVWKPLRSMIIGLQAHISMVLLAYNVKGCLILRKGMWQVPIM